MSILGLHHITLICADAQRTIDFYTDVLGMRLVKKTVNFDDPSSYHLYFGDATGSPGSAITFFEWRDAPRGRIGVGGTHHFAIRVRDYDGLLKWKRRLTDRGIRVDGPFDRNYFKSIYFRDPDGVILEIATDGPGWLVDEDAATLGTERRDPPEAMIVSNRDAEKIKATTWPEPVSEITADMALLNGMHHITAMGENIERLDAFYSNVLGFQRVKMTLNFDDPTSAHWYWGVDGGRPGTLITYFERNPRKDGYAQMGTGLTHHFAFAVADEEVQKDFRARLLRAGFPVSEMRDRIYFKSIYSRDPDGHVIEIATVGPGFAFDEDVSALGTGLMLPPWLESRREWIESSLTPVSAAAWQMPEQT